RFALLGRGRLGGDPLESRAPQYIEADQLAGTKLIGTLVGGQLADEWAGAVHGDRVGLRVDFEDTALQAARPTVDRLHVPPARPDDINPPCLGMDATGDWFVPWQVDRLIDHQVKQVVGA